MQVAEHLKKPILPSGLLSFDILRRRERFNIIRAIYRALTKPVFRELLADTRRYEVYLCLRESLALFGNRPNATPAVVNRAGLLQVGFGPS